MEVTDVYLNFLLQLLDYNDDNLPDMTNNKDTFIINLYLTLLSLNNHSYNDEQYDKESTIIKDFLRKLNNLKVKIQLKRKDTEIDKLSSEIIEEYQTNQGVLSRYIKELSDLEKPVQDKDAKELTSLIDKSTKAKMNDDEERENLKKKSSLINSLNNSFYISDGLIYFKNNQTSEEITMSYEEFLKAYSYLLDINNYHNPYTKANSNKSYTIIISNIIKMLMTANFTNEEISNILIPTILNYLLSLNNVEYKCLNTESFNIENIKISDLYSLAKEETQQETLDEKTTKWRNISIPNSYLISRLKELVRQGLYYFKEDMFIFEEQKDFKISIKIEKMIAFLEEALLSNKSKPKAK